MREPGRSYQGEPISLEDAKAHLAFSITMGKYHNLGSHPNSHHAFQAFLKVGVYNYRTCQRKAPQEGGAQVGHETREVSVV